MNPVIDYFMSRPPMAVVGVSDKKMGGAIYKELKKRGVTVYPVHPRRETFDGDHCFASLASLPDGVKTAIIAVSPEAAESVVEDAAKSGIKYLWFQQGKDFSTAVAKAEAKGIQAVSRKCILMYAGNVTGVHSVHRFFVRLFGKYEAGAPTQHAVS